LAAAWVTFGRPNETVRHQTRCADRPGNATMEYQPAR
jgi:hypothetical protein